MSVRINKLVNNIDKEDADYFLKVSNKEKKEILKKIMKLNEDMRSQQKSLVNSKYTHEAVKMVINKSEQKSDEVKKRKQYNTSEINYRASYISQRMNDEEGLEVYKGWCKQIKQQDSAHQFVSQAKSSKEGQKPF